jgi:hypothetical protein
VSVLNEEDFTKGALPYDVDHLEILKLHLDLGCAPLENDLRFSTRICDLVEDRAITLGKAVPYGITISVLFVFNDSMEVFNCSM